MAEYIKKADVLAYPIRADHCDKEHANEHFILGIESVLEYVEQLPAVDVAPVVHGRWQRVGIFKKEGPIYPCCSACGTVSAAYRSQWEGLQGPWRYCPVCGAKMDGGDGDAGEDAPVYGVRGDDTDARGGKGGDEGVEGGGVSA